MRRLGSKYQLRDPRLVEVQILLDLPHYTEGPARDKNGSLFFTDLAGHAIWILDGDLTKKWASGKRPNGQIILEDGSHLVCDSEEACILHYSRNAEVIGNYGRGTIEGLAVRCPNDLCLHPQKGFYFTDSVRQTGAVFFVGWDGTQRIVAQDIDFANGISLSHDQHTLYVAESYQNRILCFTLDGPGICTTRPRVFGELPTHPDGKITDNLPDGIAIDEDGRVWIAHYGMQAVHVLSPNGKMIASYNTTMPLTSNLCFSGLDLIVTGGFGEPGPGRVVKMNVFEN